MGISTTTRKSLWAKSGNRCALCRLELVQDDDQEENVIIGQECHIISSRKNGPRGDENLHCDDFDEYENLILLCANDHKRIDSLTEIYSANILIQLKKAHETWVNLTLSIDPLSFTNDKFKVAALKKVESGIELVRLVDSAHACNFDYEDFKSNEEIEAIPSLLDLLKDYIDIWTMMSIKEKAELGLDLNKYIEKIEDLGFQVFGLRRNVRLRNDKKEDMGLFDIATVVIVRKDNPGIVDKYLITRTPDKFRFNF